MKKLYLMAFALMAVTMFTACGDDTEEEAKASIVGEWKFSDGDVDLKIDNLPVLDYLTESLGMSEDDAALYAALYESFYELAAEGGTITFNANNTYTAKSTGEAPETGTYELSADGKTLTTDPNTADEQVLNVETLTDSSLEVSVEFEEEDDWDESGDDETIWVKATMKLAKQ